MCELFGFSAAAPAELGPALEEFFSHSVRHPHGWGLAQLDGAAARIHKEPLRAIDSAYLRRLLAEPMDAPTVLAHIRLATVGNVAWRNCHPYTLRDQRGRRWTLIHNGTIFHFPPMDRYYTYTDSDTDSACLLSYLTAQQGQKGRQLGRDLTARERFDLLEALIAQISPGNKLNLLLYDGELLYVHTNLPGTLYQREYAGGRMFSTCPLSAGDWTPVPQTQLLAFDRGRLRFSGAVHGGTYHEDPERTRLLYLSYAAL